MKTDLAGIMAGLVAGHLCVVALLPTGGCLRAACPGDQGISEGLGGQDERRVRRTVLTAIKDLQYPNSSKISYTTNIVPAGSRIKGKYKTLEGKSVLIEEDGYLVYFDLQPDMDWAHKWQVVLVPVNEGTSCSVLVSEVSFASFIIVDKSNSQQQVEWMRLQ